MTKLEYEKRKRMKTLAVVAVCTAAILFALAAQESYAKSSLWVRGGVTIPLCGAVMAAAVRYWAANDEYRIVKREFIRKNGQMPFSKTVFSIQHKVIWWVDCKNKRIHDISFRSRMEAEKYMQKTINDWNSTYIKSENNDSLPKNL